LSNSAAIYGCAGTVLTAEERAFFADVRPWGFILFRRNVESPEQVLKLTLDLRDAVGWDCPVLVDQEGGRVQRLGPPHWSKYPPGEAFLKATNDPLAARELARLGGRLMAHDLKAVGINIDCAPVLDVPTTSSATAPTPRIRRRWPSWAARWPRGYWPAASCR
jgi:beta-N-acetylhexosaminidase